MHSFENMKDFRNNDGSRLWFAVVLLSSKQRNWSKVSKRRSTTKFPIVIAAAVSVSFYVYTRQTFSSINSNSHFSHTYAVYITHVLHIYSNYMMPWRLFPPFTSVARCFCIEGRTTFPLRRIYITSSPFGYGSINISNYFRERLACYDLFEYFFFYPFPKNWFFDTCSILRMWRFNTHVVF